MREMAKPAEFHIRSLSPGVLHRTLRMGLRLSAVLILLAGITFGSFHVAHVNAMTAGFLYLIAVLVLATTWGLPEAIAASIGGALCLDYFFFPPIGVFNIDDPQDWVAFFTFLATALTASDLSALAKRQTREESKRRHEIGLLYELSRAILLADATQPLAKQIADNIAATFGYSGVALYDRAGDRTYCAGPQELAGIESKLKEAALRSVPVEGREREAVIVPILLGGEFMGSLAVQGELPSGEALQSVLNLVAMGLQKARAQDAVNRAEVARQGEELKSKLLDGFAHEFKTPITSVKAATTCLLTNLSKGLDRQQHEMITIADRGADRLAKLVNDSIQLARIEGGQFHIREELHSPSSLISVALKQINPMAEGREIRIEAEDSLPPFLADGELIQLAIRQLVDNSLKYSPAGSAITIAAQASEAEVIISVSDLGPGIPEAEQARIFDKFYRGIKDRYQIQGTGIGLTAVREIVHAHGGKIQVQSSPGKGSIFSLFLPVASKEKSS